MTGIEFFLAFVAGFWLTHLLAAVAVLLGATGITAVIAIAWRLMRDDPLTADEQAAIDWAERLGGPPPELAPARVLAPPGTGGNTWATANRRTPRHAAGPQRAGAKTPGWDGKHPDSPPNALSGGQHHATAHAPVAGALGCLNTQPGPDLGPGSEPCGVTGPAPDGGPPPTLPAAVTDALDGLAATVAELAKPTDGERWPWLVPGEGYENPTGWFAAIVGVE